MQQNTEWRAVPVWKCSEQRCGEQWAAKERFSCPFCHCGIGQQTGFTCGEVADIAEKFGFKEEFPIHIPGAIPDVVQLSILPPTTWVGLPVFHPCSQEETQEGTLCNWLLYDVGVVINIFPDPDFPDEFLCQFVYSVGSINGTLQYQPSNLWVPRALAERLK